jgi:hypothetical protein
MACAVAGRCPGPCGRRWAWVVDGGGLGSSRSRSRWSVFCDSLWSSPLRRGWFLARELVVWVGAGRNPWSSDHNGGRRLLDAAYLHGGAVEVPFPIPSNRPEQKPNIRFGLDGVGAVGVVSSLEAPSRVGGAADEWYHGCLEAVGCVAVVLVVVSSTRPLYIVVIGGCSVVFPLRLGLPWALKLLALLLCSSQRGGPVWPFVDLMVCTPHIQGWTSPSLDGLAPFDPGRGGRVPLQQWWRLLWFLRHLKLLSLWCPWLTCLCFC